MLLPLAVKLDTSGLIESVIAIRYFIKSDFSKEVLEIPLNRINDTFTDGMVTYRDNTLAFNGVKKLGIVASDNTVRRQCYAVLPIVTPTYDNKRKETVDVYSLPKKKCYISDTLGNVGEYAHDFIYKAFGPGANTNFDVSSIDKDALANKQIVFAGTKPDVYRCIYVDKYISAKFLTTSTATNTGAESPLSEFVSQMSGSVKAYTDDMPLERKCYIAFCLSALRKEKLNETECLTVYNKYKQSGAQGTYVEYLYGVMSKHMTYQTFCDTVYPESDTMKDLLIPAFGDLWAEYQREIADMVASQPETQAQLDMMRAIKMGIDATSHVPYVKDQSVRTAAFWYWQRNALRESREVAEIYSSEGNMLKAYMEYDEPIRALGLWDWLYYNHASGINLTTFDAEIYSYPEKMSWLEQANAEVYAAYEAEQNPWKGIVECLRQNSTGNSFNADQLKTFKSAVAGEYREITKALSACMNIEDAESKIKRDWANFDNVYASEGRIAIAHTHLEMTFSYHDGCFYPDTEATAYYGDANDTDRSAECDLSAFAILSPITAETPPKITFRQYSTEECLDNLLDALHIRCKPAIKGYEVYIQDEPFTEEGSDIPHIFTDTAQIIEYCKDIFPDEVTDTLEKIYKQYMPAEKADLDTAFFADIYNNVTEATVEFAQVNAHLLALCDFVSKPTTSYDSYFRNKFGSELVLTSADVLTFKPKELDTNVNTESSVITDNFYQAYCIDWIKSHISAETLDEAVDEFNTSEYTDFTDYLFDNNGFNGELFASLDEFIDNEFCDLKLINDLKTAIEANNAVASLTGIADADDDDIYSAIASCTDAEFTNLLQKYGLVLDYAIIYAEDIDDEDELFDDFFTEETVEEPKTTVTATMELTDAIKATAYSAYKQLFGTITKLRHLDMQTLAYNLQQAGIAVENATETSFTAYFENISVVIAINPSDRQAHCANHVNIFVDSKLFLTNVPVTDLRTVGDTDLAEAEPSQPETINVNKEEAAAMMRNQYVALPPNTKKVSLQSYEDNNILETLTLPPVAEACDLTIARKRALKNIELPKTVNNLVLRVADCSKTSISLPNSVSSLTIATEDTGIAGELTNMPDGVCDDFSLEMRNTGADSPISVNIAANTFDMAVRNGVLSEIKHKVLRRSSGPARFVFKDTVTSEKYKGIELTSESGNYVSTEIQLYETKLSYLFAEKTENAVKHCTLSLRNSTIDTPVLMPYADCRLFANIKDISGISIRANRLYLNLRPLAQGTVDLYNCSTNQLFLNLTNPDVSEYMSVLRLPKRVSKLFSIDPLALIGFETVIIPKGITSEMFVFSYDNITSTTYQQITAKAKHSCTVYCTAEMMKAIKTNLQTAVYAADKAEATNQHNLGLIINAYLEKIKFKPIDTCPEDIISTSKATRYREKCVVSAETALAIDYWLNVAPTEDKHFGEDDKISASVKFENGYCADIELCGVQFEDSEDSDNKPWTQLVLYNERGGEAGCTDVDEMFFDTWEYATDDATYIVDTMIDDSSKIIKHIKDEIRSLMSKIPSDKELEIQLIDGVYKPAIYDANAGSAMEMQYNGIIVSESLCKAAGIDIVAIFDEFDIPYVG